jgi:hypothetical protein
VAGSGRQWQHYRRTVVLSVCACAAVGGSVDGSAYMAFWLIVQRRRDASFASVLAADARVAGLCLPSQDGIVEVPASAGWQLCFKLRTCIVTDSAQKQPRSITSILVVYR